MVARVEASNVVVTGIIASITDEPTEWTTIFIYESAHTCTAAAAAAATFAQVRFTAKT